MAFDDFDQHRLAQLHSTDQAKLLDEIDKLRSQGISHYVSLPQLIVCGDQSSGKSSVLEAISGISFPTKDNLCTRFATEVILRRTPTTNVSVAIVPSQTRPKEECNRLLLFGGTLTDFNQLPSLIDKAKEAMGISTTGNAFSNDVLRIEVSGPNRPHLTIVDLPGLIHSENKLQSAADVAIVLGMIRTYMKNRRSIILAIVSAKNDYANQIVLKLAKEMDPNGLRTLGVVTKPDTLYVGSESEIDFANLARNEDIEFRLGWHVLRNRDYGARDSSTEARDLAEQAFFSQGIWKEFPSHMVGINSLRTRLSTVLLEQIRTELPSLVEEIESSIQDCRTRLDKLGISRGTLDEQRIFLLRISQAFQSLAKAAINGLYSDSFFGDPRSFEGYCKRLRAVVQNLSLDFAETMRTKGHRREIVAVVLKGNPKQIAASINTPKKIARSEYVDEIRDLLKRTRGRELPGMFNPLIVGDLFWEQSQPWEGLARQHLRDTWDATKTFLELTLSHLTDEVTSEALLRELIDPLMKKKFQLLEEKLTEILAPYQKGHPITYNHYFTETIQNVREKRRVADMKSRLKGFFGYKESETMKQEIRGESINVESLLSALTSQNELDMDRYACSEILDCMEAYYKVTMKTVVDNVATQTVEGCLMNNLEDLISPTAIMNMEPGLVSGIAAESSSNQMDREQLSRKLTVLELGLETCQRYVTRNASIRRMQPPAAVQETPRYNGGKPHIDREESSESVSEDDSAKTVWHPPSNAGDRY